MRIALAAGDGIGPEIMDATLALFHAAGVQKQIEFVPVEMGKAVFAKGNSRGISDSAVRTVEELGVLFKGPMETPKGGGGKSINVTARKMWSAFANYRHFRTLPGVVTPYSKAGMKMNFSIVRENIEDTYGGIEHRLSNDTVQCKRLTSAPGSDQVCRYAFETAAKLGLTKVHCGHKANIMKMTDGLFLERFRAAAADYPGIEPGDVIVDALCMNLVMHPEQYQMVVLPNLQGDIVSDLAAGLVGGLGFAPSANIGRQISIFEAVHGTAPDIAGKRIANPTALILSGLMMLRHVGFVRMAALIENALLAALEDGVHTGDFGDPSTPPCGTDDYVRAIVKRLGSRPREVPAVPEIGEDRLIEARPTRPSEPIVMHTFTNVRKEIVGCDVYLDALKSAPELASDLETLAQGSPFKLVIISNRGTQVWPTGSIFTECVDYWRARFELRDPMAAARTTQADAVKLLDAIAARHTISSYELLRTFDGVRGYSLAQGQ
ncbi:MAG: isocitrate/isopropylmalate family dehydrogenase [Phycisphaerales bacterium]